jgi:rhamnose utilization protein RhaD (predicted bifunctional aldolase and dehydrogenase)
MSMNDLIAVSRRYGADLDYVVAGGGNTSWKNAGELYIKGSGASLDTITEAGFVKMDRRKLAAIWTSSYPDDQDLRESAVLKAMMEARCAGEEKKRPSVETLLHDLLPFAFVVHTHPALVNGITCSALGIRAAQDLFGDDCLWIPSTNPGYILCKSVKDAWKAHTVKTGRQPAFILLQNHGIFVAADSVAGIDATYKRVTSAINARITRRADFSPLVTDAASEAAAGAEAQKAAGLLARLAGATAPASVHHSVDKELARLTASREAFGVLAKPFSPDHIVYAGSDFLFAEGPGPELEKAYADFVTSHGRAPKLAAVRGLGVFGIGGNDKSARLAVDLFRDAAKIAACAEAFGGPRYMTQDQIDFINNWEVERYRQKISTGA